MIKRSGRLGEIWWSVWISKSQRSLCVSFSRTAAGLCIYHLFVWSNLNFLHISQWITLITHSCLVLYSFGDNLLHSLDMWLMVPSLSPHNLHLVLCCVLSILALIWFDWFLWHCFVLQLGLFFSATSTFSRVRCRLPVVWNVLSDVFLPTFVFWLLSFRWYSCH